MEVYLNRVELPHPSLSIQSSAQHQRVAIMKLSASASNPRWVQDLLLDPVRLEPRELLDHHSPPSFTELPRPQLLLRSPAKAHLTSRRNSILNENNPNPQSHLQSLLPLLHHLHHAVGKISWLGLRLSRREKAMSK